VDEAEAAIRRQEVITLSREKYGTTRADVEAMLAKSRATPEESPAPPTPKPKETLPRQAPKAVEIAPPSPPDISPKPPEVLPPVVLPELAPAPVAEKKTPSTPTDLGKGGEQHKAMQRRIKEAADALGFRSVIEHQIAEGSQESVDLFLERGEVKIACEISVSTTIDHEVGNVRKCLKAGLPQVAIICLSEDRLQKIAAAIAGSLGTEAAANVSYHQPDPFIVYLKSVPMPVVKKNAVKMNRGYKVKSSAPTLTDEERRQREELANKMMAESMRPKIKTPSKKIL
jgi:hypothetical protein